MALDVVAEDGEHLDDVGERDVYGSGFDESVLVSKVHVLGAVEDRGDTRDLGGVGYAAEEDGALELDTGAGRVLHLLAFWMAL